MPEAFVYCWTDHSTHKLYVGWHKGAPNDGYVCSSKVMLQEYKKRPHDFTREVLASGNTNDMLNFETKILTAANAAKDPMFYNMHNGNGKFTHNQPHTEESIKKFRAMHVHRTKYAKDWKFNETQLLRIRLARKKFWDNVTDEERIALFEKRESAKKKAALRKMNEIVSVCPHCNKGGNHGAMKRWHFDNCRNKHGN
jgi:ribosomal protein L3